MHAEVGQGCAGPTTLPGPRFCQRFDSAHAHGAAQCCGKHTEREIKLIQLRWGRFRPIGINYVYRSHAYDTGMNAVGCHYEVEKVYSPGPKGYGWYATSPNWDGGFFDSLTDAKAACSQHHREGMEAGL